MPAESGDMGVLANHVPSIEQLNPGLVEVIEEAGGSKQFFRRYTKVSCTGRACFKRILQKAILFGRNLGEYR